ncbi:MAG: hypothetical protein VX304_09205, partial [Planctomycetota bacterium]|nr:hypothetical protein [Planctomycetota bacterium]
HTPLSLDESEHPDLPIGELNKRRETTGATSGALVVNRYGQLVSHGRSPLEVNREIGEGQQLAYDRQPWQDLLNKKKPGDSNSNTGFQFSSNNPMGGNAEGGSGKKKNGRGKKNPIRRDNAYGGGMMGGMGGGMGGMGGMGGGMPGMGGGMPGMGGGIPGMSGGMGGGAIPGMGGGGPMGGGFPGGGPMGGGGGPMGGGGFPGQNR